MAATSLCGTILDALKAAIEEAKLFDMVSIGLVQKWDTHASICMILPTGDIEHGATNVTVQVEYEITLAFGIMMGTAEEATKRLLEVREDLKGLFRYKDLAGDKRVLMMDVVGGAIIQYRRQTGFQVLSELLLRVQTREAV